MKPNPTQIFYPLDSGFYGAYYPSSAPSDSAMLYMLGPTADSPLIKAGARWLNRLGVNVLALAPDPEHPDFYDLPLERFDAAIAALKALGNRRFGVCGGSIHGMLALLAAAHCPEITLTIAMTPCDFVAEGFIRDGLDGAMERPADGHAVVSLGGKTLPHLPYAYRHPDYALEIKAEGKRTGNLAASKAMFDRSEVLHPLQEEEMIPVERIQGTLLLCGGRDDCLWDTEKYIHRMEQRLREKSGQCRCVTLLYDHGTHFLFPQSMLTSVLPVGSFLLPLVFRAGRKHPFACKQSRIAFDRQAQTELRRWMLS